MFPYHFPGREIKQAMEKTVSVPGLSKKTLWGEVGRG